MFDSLPIGLYSTMPEGQVIDINQAMVDILGYPDKETLAAKKVNEIYVNPDDRDRLIATLNKERVVRNFSTQFFRFDGEIIWAEGHTTIVENETGEITLEGGLIDITERKLAEEELRKEQDFNKAIIDASPIFFLTIDHQGRTRMMNKSMLKALGYEWEEVRGKEYLPIFVPEREHEMVSKIFEERSLREEATLSKNHALTKSGEELLTEWHGSSVLNPNGEVDYFFGYGIDITEKRQAEKQLQENEAKFRALFENSGYAMGVPKVGFHTMVNPAYLEMFGYDHEDELIGKPILDLIAPYEREIVLENVRMRNQGEPVPLYYETRGIRKDGCEFDMDVQVSIYNLADGMYTVAILRDITERKRADKVLQESEEKFSKLFQTSPNVLMISTFEEGKIIEVNDVGVQSIGLPKERLLGKTALELGLIDVETRGQLLKLIEEQGYYTAEEIPVTLSSGEQRVGLFYGQVITMGDQKYLFQTIVDITEGKLAEGALKKYANRLEILHEIDRGILAAQSTAEIA